MWFIYLLVAILIGTPIILGVIKSLNVLNALPSDYYDFTHTFEGTKAWSIALYVVVIGVLTFFTLFISFNAKVFLPA